MNKKTCLRWIMVGLLAVGWGVTAAAEFAGGDGSAEDPFQVETAEHLNAVRDHLDAHFVQTADINLGVAPWNEGAGWEPIGTDDEAFTGSYDGDGFRISGMTIDRPDTSFLGLFLWVTDGLLSNVIMDNFTVTGGDYCGGLVGYIQEGTLIDCFADSFTVTGGGYCGGLAGLMYKGTLIDCQAHGDVVGSGFYVGGLMGAVIDIQIRACSASGNVEGVGGGVGGLVGVLQESTMSDCHAHGDVVRSGSYVGGLIGQAYRAEISGSSASGAVEGEGIRVGGLIGLLWESSLSGSYATGSVVGSDRGVGGLVGDAITSEIHGSSASGDVEGADDEVGGLVGQLSASSLSGSYASGSVVGGSGAGGLVGYVVDASTVSGCHAVGNVFGRDWGVGGLVGGNAGTIIVDCYATGRVESETGYVGGLVGVSYSTIRRCRASGDVVANTLPFAYGAGGLVGYQGLLDDPSLQPLIENAHASGSVTANFAPGVTETAFGAGLVGMLEGGSVRTAYATGFVQGTAELGGLVGVRQMGLEITASYWDMNSTGQATSDGGKGRTTADMTYPHDGDTYVGWDFAEVWSPDADGAVNDGYPYLGYNLVYAAGAGGQLSGALTQRVPMGHTGLPVAVVPDAGAVFAGWSDGRLDSPRTDGPILGNLSVLASFSSASGVDIDWYAEHEIEPGNGETWADVDERYDADKRMTLAEQFIADLDPNDPTDLFVIKEMPSGAGIAFNFRSSASRVYKLEATFDLVDGPWVAVTGAGPRAGVDGPDSFTDANTPPIGTIYRLTVTLPEP